MAQRAFVPFYRMIEGTNNLNEMKITFDCLLLEETVTTANGRELSIVTQWNDNNAQIKAKIIAEIMAYAADANYNTLQASAIVLPSYVKG